MNLKSQRFKKKLGNLNYDLILKFYLVLGSKKSLYPFGVFNFAFNSSGI